MIAALILLGEHDPVDLIFGWHKHPVQSWKTFIRPCTFIVSICDLFVAAKQ